MRHPVLSIVFLVQVLCLSTGVKGQNLVPNPDFETFSVCPPGLGMGTLQCTPWFIPSIATTDYFNSCAPGGVVGVPYNFVGFQYAHSGQAYVGGYMWMGNTGFDYREYAEVQLTEPLMAGMTYDVSFYFNLSNTNRCHFDKLGVYFSVAQVSYSNSDPLPYTPQVEYTGGMITDTANWTLFSGCYVAAGGEQYITIGNFYSDAETNSDGGCGMSTFSYLYIDDVSVTLNGAPPGEIPFDLGPPVVTCDNYLIAPGIPNASYVWQDGTNSTTYNVTQSGTYSVTITSGCNFGTDEIDVTILESADPVELGDDLQVLCDGNTIQIDLDPDAGDYVWQDNSTNPGYTITSGGVYSVTLTDACGMSTDEITVLEESPPPPIYLGADTTLCVGSGLTLSLNPAFGDITWQDMSTGSQITVTQPGTYSATISNVCGMESDAIDVDFLDAPIFDYPEDTLFACAGESYIIEIHPGGLEVEWQDGITDSLYEVYTPGWYSVSISNMCGFDVDQIYVDFVDAPVVSLGPDLILCPGQLPYILDLGSIPYAEEFFWQDGSSDPVYSITSAGTYSVTVSNPCFQDFDQIIIEIQDAAPAIDLPDTIKLCDGDMELLDVSAIPGTYEWQDGSTNGLYMISTPGHYSVTVTNQCGTDSAAVQVNLLAPVPVFDLGPDLSLCPGDQIQLSVNLPGSDLLWQDGSTGSTYTVSAAGQVILMASNSCGTYADTVEVAVDGAPPQLSLPATVSLCTGESIMLDAGIGGVVYQWNTGSDQSQITASAPGLYILTVTNSCGTAEDSVVVIDGGAAPTAELGNDLEICAGSSIDVTVSTEPGATILWNDGSTMPTVSASVGELSVIVTNSCGVAYDTLQITALPPTPGIDLGPDTTLCPGETLLLSPGIAGVNYQWSDGSSGNTFLATQPGQVFVQITDQCGTSTDTLNIAFQPDQPALDLGNDIALCPGETAVIDPGISIGNIIWHDGSTTPTYTALQPGTVYVTISTDCWEISDTVEIYENSDAPTITLGPDITLCEGESVLLNPGVAGVMYQWQNGSTSPTYLVSQTEQVVVQISNACGMDSDTLNVLVNGTMPTVDLGADTLLCSGSTITLAPEVPGGGSFVWQDGSQAQTLLVTGGGTYALTVSNTCGQAVDSIIIDFENTPLPFSLGQDTLLCEGEMISLSVQANAGDQIVWSTAEISDQITVQASGQYWALVTNSCGQSGDTVNVNYNTNAIQVALEPMYKICTDDNLVLDVSQPFAAQYQWNDGTALPTIQVVDPGGYAVTISTECDLIVGTTEVVIDPCAPPLVIFVPNIFSPNHDQINDVFAPSISDPALVTEFSFEIYDRWGGVLFATGDISSGWNGSTRGKDVPPGVYVYLVRWKDVQHGSEQQVQYGDITLIR